MIEKINNELKWIYECVEAEEKHLHSSVYLLQHNGSNIIIDTGPFTFRNELKSQVNEAIDGGQVDSILLLTNYAHHSSNVNEFDSEWENVEIILPVGQPGTQGIPTPVTTYDQPRGAVTIEGRKFTITESPLMDLPTSSWIYDHKGETYFTIDGFGHYHSPNNCEALVDIEETGYNDISRYYADKIIWTQYADPIKLCSEIWSLIYNFQPNRIAPAHGRPILKSDILDHMQKLTNYLIERDNSFTLHPYDEYHEPVP